jgi:hypothetical protein
VEKCAKHASKLAECLETSIPLQKKKEAVGEITWRVSSGERRKSHLRSRLYLQSGYGPYRAQSYRSHGVLQTGLGVALVATAAHAEFVCGLTVRTLHIGTDNMRNYKNYENNEGLAKGI